MPIIPLLRIIAISTGEPRKEGERKWQNMACPAAPNDAFIPSLFTALPKWMHTKILDSLPESEFMFRLVLDCLASQQWCVIVLLKPEMDGNRFGHLSPSCFTSQSAVSGNWQDKSYLGLQEEMEGDLRHWQAVLHHWQAHDFPAGPLHGRTGGRGRAVGGRGRAAICRHRRRFHSTTFAKYHPIINSATTENSAKSISPLSSSSSSTSAAFFRGNCAKGLRGPEAPPTVISSNIKPPHAGLPLAGSPPPSLSPRLDIKRPMARRRAECFDSDGRQGARGSEREGGREGRGGGEREGRGRYGRRAEAPLLYNRALLRHLPTLISNSQWAVVMPKVLQHNGQEGQESFRYACF